MQMDRLHQDSNIYNMYNEYLNTVQKYALNTMKSIPIKYYRTNMIRTKNIDTELNYIDSKWYNKSYDVFEMTPVIEATPLTYSTEMDESNQGVVRRTQGSITIFGINKPVVGDLFIYYSNNVDSENNEYFTVDNVNFIKTSTDINIYNLEFSSANIKASTVSNLNILNQFYYLKEFHKFYDVVIYNDYINMFNNRNDYIDNINRYYNNRYAKYIFNDDSDINNNYNYYISVLNNKYNLGFKYVRNPINNNLPLENDINNINSEVIDQLILINRIYNTLENYQMDQFNAMGTDINISNQTVKDLEGNILNG